MPTPKPRLYLVTPRQFEPSAFAAALGPVLEAGDVACLRLRLGDGDEAHARKAIAAIKPVSDSAGVALLIEDAPALAAETGADGVHLTRANTDMRPVRDALGPDGVIGVWCEASQHEGLVAGERGADYVSFGPVAGDPALMTGPLAEKDLFDWWQHMIEIPVVAEGGVTPDIAATLVASADFIVLDASIWDSDPTAAVGAMQSAIGAAAQT